METVLPPEVEPGSTTDLARQIARQPRTVKDLLQGPEFKKALAEVLPRAMRPERFVRVALICLMKTPELAECSKESLFKCMLDLSSYGLEPDGRRAHLIPFKNRKMCQCGHLQDEHKGQQCIKCDCNQRRTLVECTLIIDYKGIVELVRRSGDVSYIHADVVYEHDEWSYGFGSEAHLRHKPALKDRGKERIAFYSYVKLRDGSEDFMVLSPAEVEAVRRRSKSPDNGPWVTDYDEMGKKTCFRRHSKWLPLSPEVRDVVERDDDAIDVNATSTWDELLGSTGGPDGSSEPRRLTAREKLQQANFAEKPQEPVKEDKPE